MNITVRLRHPRGVSTLTLDPEKTTIEDLQSMIFSQTEIVPSAQELKYSYPPKPLPSDESTLLSAVPITKGEQIVVTESTTKSGSTASSHATTTTESPKSPKIPPAAAAAAAPRPPGPPMIRQSAPVSSAPAVKAPPPTSSSPAQAAGGGATKPPGKESVVVDLPDGNGVMNHVIVPDDNSCLFTSVATIFLGGMDYDLASGLRQVVAEEIRSNPAEYPDVVLGRPREEYISTILKPQSWGGAIELAIFAKHFTTEIASFDVQSGRADRFGEGQYDSRCVLVYSGIHYDAVTTSPMRDAPREFQTTVFPISDETILPAAKELVRRLKEQRYYTDTAGFDLRCQVCKAGLKGEKEAREHAKATGHVEFGEY